MIGERAPFRRGWTRHSEQNSRKPAKADENKNACIAFSYFSESGLFNGLRSIQVRKFLSFLSSGHAALKRLARSATGGRSIPHF
jgi:hypothetical protein